MKIKKYNRSNNASREQAVASSASAAASSSSSSTTTGAIIDRTLWGNHDDGGDINGDLNVEGRISATEQINGRTLVANEKIYFPYPTGMANAIDLAELLQSFDERIEAVEGNDDEDEDPEPSQPSQPSEPQPLPDLSYDSLFWFLKDAGERKLYLSVPRALVIGGASVGNVRMLEARGTLHVLLETIYSIGTNGALQMVTSTIKTWETTFATLTGGTWGEWTLKNEL